MSPPRLRARDDDDAARDRALLARHVEGFPVAEAAAILEVPEGTVKSRCARARGRLAALLADLAPEGGNPAPALPVQPDETQTGAGVNDSRGDA